jgi:hypothetical protein
LIKNMAIANDESIPNSRLTPGQSKKDNTNSSSSSSSRNSSSGSSCSINDVVESNPEEDVGLAEQGRYLFTFSTHCGQV